MIGLILAAGRGSRLGAMTDARPKCLTILAGRPLISYQIDSLRAGGCSKVGLVTGYAAHCLQEYGDFNYHNADWGTSNMVTSLEAAGELLESKTVIVCYSDIVFESVAVRQLGESEFDLAISYDVNWESLWTKRFTDPLSDAETFRLDTAGMVQEIGHKPSSISDVQGQYMGLLKMTPNGWSSIEAARNSMHASARLGQSMTELLGGLVEMSVQLGAIPYSDWWFEIDTPNDLRLAEEDLARTQRP